MFPPLAKVSSILSTTFSWKTPIHASKPHGNVTFSMELLWFSQDKNQLFPPITLCPSATVNTVVMTRATLSRIQHFLVVHHRHSIRVCYIDIFSHFVINAALHSRAVSYNDWWFNKERQARHESNAPWWREICKRSKLMWFDDRMPHTRGVKGMNTVLTDLPSPSLLSAGLLMGSEEQTTGGCTLWCNQAARTV